MWWLKGFRNKNKATELRKLPFFAPHKEMNAFGEERAHCGNILKLYLPPTSLPA